MFEIVEITLHGRTKYEIIYASGGKHVAYLNDKSEAQNVVRFMNSANKTDKINKANKANKAK